MSVSTRSMMLHSKSALITIIPNYKLNSGQTILGDLEAISTNIANLINEILLELGKDHSMQACEIDSPFVSFAIFYLAIFLG